MKKVERTMRARHVYHGFGFPVMLENVPMIRMRGVWTPDVCYEHLQRMLLLALAAKNARFTGHEVRFVRLSFEMNLKSFASRFGVTHPAVLKWERAASRSSAMAWSTEKDLRLLIVSRLGLKAERFVRIYRDLESVPGGPSEPLSLDLSSVA